MTRPGRDHAPPGAIRVGITGHRPNKLPPDAVPPVRAALHDLLGRLEAAHRRAHPDDTRACLLVTGLAEGADRIAVEAAPDGWSLAALLPMPREDYARDFVVPGEGGSPALAEFDALLARADSVTELPLLPPDPPHPRSAQYAELGHVLVREVDWLVAVWDGRPAAGPGGTADVVREALEHGVPVLRVDPAAPGRIERVLALPPGGMPVAVRLEGGAIDAPGAFTRPGRPSSP